MKQHAPGQFDMDNPHLVSTLDELPLWSAPFGLYLLDMVDLKREITALDIGCGTGFPLLELAQRLGPTAKVFGLDPWQGGMERIKIKIEQYQIGNVTLLEGKSEKIPLEDRSVDLIVSNNGLNNVEDLKKTIEECARVIKPGGQLIFTFNLAETMELFYTVLDKVMTDFGIEDSIDKIADHIYEKRKPVVEYSDLLMANKFTIDELQEDDFYWNFADGTAFLNHYSIRIGFKSSWEKLIEEKNRQKIFSKVEEELNTLSELEGYLSLRIPFVAINCRKQP